MNKYILLLCLSIASVSFAAESSDTTNTASKVQSDASGIESTTQAQTAAETSAVTSAQASALGSSTRKLKGNPFVSTGKPSRATAPHTIRNDSTKPSEQNKSGTIQAASTKTTSPTSTNQSSDNNKTIVPPASQGAVSGVAGAVIATTVAETSSVTSSTSSAISNAEIFSIAIACF